jgi:two-component system phosphate regulon response regulator PhoB
VLLNNVWGYDYFGTTRTVDVHVRRLREKLGPYADHLQTVKGYGYQFKAAGKP